MHPQSLSQHAQGRTASEAQGNKLCLITTGCWFPSILCAGLRGGITAHGRRQDTAGNTTTLAMLCCTHYNQVRENNYGTVPLHVHCNNNITNQVIQDSSRNLIILSSLCFDIYHINSRACNSDFYKVLLLFCLSKSGIVVFYLHVAL